VRDPLTGGFDSAQTRELVRVGSNQLNNANALTLLPNNDLIIADFDSGNLRIVRDTNNDGVPDTRSHAVLYLSLLERRALDIAANKRGVVFSHSFGNDAVLLALYDDNLDGRADAEEVVAEGLSLDNNLLLHGLTVDRDGTIYVVEDASGASDSIANGGNNGTPRISAFADPTMEGF
jgi:glucose/arabinose dehydrogenase